MGSLDSVREFVGLKPCTEIRVYGANEKDIIGIVGYEKEHPLSPYQECFFKYNGLDMYSVKMAMVYEKALFCLNNELANKILRTHYSEEARDINKMLRIPDNEKEGWLKYKDAKLRKILEAKFTPRHDYYRMRSWLTSYDNAKLAFLARVDENGEIIEKNEYYGISIPPHHPDIYNPNKWNQYGKNMIGKLLENIRDNTYEIKLRRKNKSI